MIRKVKIGSYKPALDNGVAIQRKLIELVCDSNQNSISINEQNILLLFVKASVKQWVKEFIGLKAEANTNNTMLDCLKGLADSSNKILILDWYNQSFNFVTHFSPNPSFQTWPTSHTIPQTEWNYLRIVLEKFYKELYRKGLPFKPDGTVTSKLAERLNREYIANRFKDENLHNVCPLCEGEIKNPRVDHWISKSDYPSLSLSPENLFPICHDCNSDYKGEKPVYENSATPFSNWFHPYLFSAENEIKLKYENHIVKLFSKNILHQNKVTNLDNLLKLAFRWTKEFQNQKELYQRNIKRKKKLKKNANGINIIDILDEMKEELGIEQTDERETFFLVRELILQEITKDQDSIDSFIEEINN